MAMSRFGRSNLKQSGKAIRSFMAERSTPLTEVGGSAMLSPSSLQTLAPCSNNTKTVPSIGQMNQLSYGLRGINTTPQHNFQQSAERIEEDSEAEFDDRRLPGLEATKPGEKPRVVVLGTGWASCRFLKGLDTSIYDVVCISPRNHMVFTPLLASTCVGTLEFRSVAEPISRIQSALSTAPNSLFYLAHCLRIDSDSHEVYCETVSNRGLPNEQGLPKEPYRFKVAYDKLVIAAGAEPLTFNIKGVKEHAFFLREVNNAQEIRKRLLLNLMKADNPGLPVEERKRLLHCVVVGGGPTGVEFSGELSDFIIKDVHEQYSHVKDDIHVTLIEANEILSSFDVGLREYATNQLTKCGVRLMRGIVKEVHEKKIVLNDGTDVIGIDQWMHVPSVEDVFAMGDCAEREGKFLVNLFNNIGKQNGGKAFSAKNINLGEPFVYKHLGSMASVGSYKALVDLRESKFAKGISHAGFVSWLIWRSAYLTRVISWRNRFYVAVNWATTLVFGRDDSRIG
ncbi:hypothetical protein MKW98_025837 [Papaver atlanticum]|uniref:NADH:ubiquinone reductase (non-electrogenic) n=1 Tax=Papaver atlanticum TaxID=357466 RepID=A0AAD4RV28_9MAGN|nr:hypothetical protein MKW98_025837 [Papaver atlanticum]